MQVIGKKMFERWTKIVGRPDLISDPLFATDIARGKNGDVLSHITSQWARELTRDECLSQLIAAGIGCGPVLSPAEVMSGTMDLVKTFMRTVAYPGSDGVPVALAPARLSQGQVETPLRPPLLGEHSDAVLAEFGFTLDEIGHLQEMKIVRQQAL